MQMKGFKQAVKKLARGTYHCVEHAIVEYHDGTTKDEWRAYISIKGWTDFHGSPKAALSNLEKMCRRGG